MEALEELKAIIAGKPDDFATYIDEGGDYLSNDDGEFQIWNSDRSCWEFVEIYALPMRSLSDIERIIELMEWQGKSFEAHPNIDLDMEALT